MHEESRIMTKRQVYEFPFPGWSDGYDILFVREAL